MSEGDLGYWREVEEQYRKAKLAEIVRQHKENVELSAIMNELKDRLPVGLHDKVREEVTNQIPPSARIESFIRVRTEEALNAIIEPIAKVVQQKRKGQKGLSSKATYKQNPMQNVHTDFRRIIKDCIQALHDFYPVIDALRLAKYNESKTNDLINQADSHIRSIDRYIEIIHRSRGTKIPMLKPLPLTDWSVSLHDRWAWFVEMQRQEHLSDEELNELESQLRALLK